MVTRTDYCPIDPIVQANPYPYYTALRQGPAATYLPEDDLWVVPHFRNVWDIVRNPDSYSSKALRALGVGAISTRVGPRPDIRELDRKMAKSLIATDLPDHTRLRRLVSRPFTPRAISTLADQIREICNEAVDELLDAGVRGEADLVTHINFPIPIRVIAAALGIPDERKDDFKRWSNALVGRLDGQPLTEKAMADLVEMTGYFQEVVAERRADPGDDLISWLITGAEAGEEPLEPRDLVSFCTLLLIAGNETTTNLLGNSFQAFFDHPDQHEAMRRSDDLATVVEEVVRYDSPVQGILRLTNEDLTLQDVTIPKDAVVLILFGSANRDETRWEDADRFDVSREPKDHLGFGSGIHLCLGAHLARLETQIAFDVIRTRVRTLEPRAETVWGGSSILRGPISQPVNLTGV